MDDRTWWLARATLIAAVAIVALDAALGKGFDTPPGFLPFCGVMLGFLGGRSYFKSKKGDDDA